MNSTCLFSSLSRTLLRASQSSACRFELHCSQRLFSSESNSQNVNRTALYELHVRHGGKMVNFADHWLPLQYKQQGISESHLHVRQAAGIFDVSHMLQTEISGEHAETFLESLCVADLKSLPIDFGTLSLFTTEHGGIVDDLIVSRMSEDSFYVVSNAGCAQKVRDLFETQALDFSEAGQAVKIDYLNDRKSLIALQGPKAVQALQSVLGNQIQLKELYFMHSRVVEFENTPLRVTRCGYTGEDGFELSVLNEKVETLVNALLANQQVKLAGLGARDSLRLEAGLCLYGNDITEETSPVEAGLVWTIGKRRREAGAATFPGANLIIAQINKEKPVTRKRVGLKAINGGPPARHGALIQSANGKQIGEVTSGCPSPQLKENIAMGYVAEGHNKLGTEVQVQIRNKTCAYKVVKMPFVPTNYYLPPKK